ncbi:MAG: hypothetical protein ACLF0P_03725 [Thermoanaerobaculia bacterium]
MNRYAVWFRRSVWLGILADWVLGIPVIFAPEWVLDTLGFRPTGDPVWTAFAALLVVLLSLFYIPGAQNPYRYRFNAWLAVLARPPGVIFFLLFRPDTYPAFGILDGALFLIQFPLLLLTLKQPAPEGAAWREPEARQVAEGDRTATWFRRAVWVGIVADWALGIPSIFWPEQVLGAVGLRPTGDPVWTSFAAMILILLSLFYIPGANRPYRYRANAHLAVWARPPGVVFFLLLWPGRYLAFGLLDLALFLMQFPLLVKVMQLRPEAHREVDDDIREYDGGTYREVKEAAFAGPYDGLPYHLGIRPGTILQFLNDSARNMHDRRDIRPYYDKLIHANGVCFAGRWRIDRPSPYTGYFATGSEGLLVARASVAGPLIKRGHRRSFGIAGKVFPTLDPDEKVWVGNFVTVSHLSGSRAKHITEIEMLNNPTVGLDPAANLINRVIFRVMDTRPGYRQLFPISTLGVPPGEPVVTPDLLMLRVAEGTPQIDAEDFRDELRLEHYPDGKLVYEIHVKNFDEEAWTRLGVLELTEYAISEGSDKRLHFWIPRDLPNPPKPEGFRSAASGTGAP